MGVEGAPSETGQRLHELGVRPFTVGLNGPDYDLAPVRDWLAFRDEQQASS